MLVEFAIALPLLILLGWGLATVSAKTFELGNDQLDDYVLESEAQYVIERITHQARAAREVKVESGRNLIRFIYHTAVEDPINPVLNVADVRETQFFIPRKNTTTGIYEALNAKRKDDGHLLNPITGGNYFGNTKINSLQFRELENNVLHIALEMESLATGRKIKINTAVFMSGCKEKVGLMPHEKTNG